MHVFKQIHLYLVGTEYDRRRGRKFLGHPSRIEGYRHPAHFSDRAPRLDIVGKPLRSAFNGINVHHISSHTDYAAHTRRSEFKVFPETVLYFFRLVFDAL